MLCFSLVLVTHDNHEHDRSLGSDPKEWIIKDVAGVLLTMELECFVAVLGLVYELPYVPDESACREQDLLHLTMVENTFSFATTVMLKKGKSCGLVIYFIWLVHLYLTTEFDVAKAGSSLMSTPKHMNKNKIFAPASPAFSSKAAVLSSAPCKQSL